MKRLQDLLARFKNIKSPDKLIEDEAKAVIEKNFGVLSKECDISFRKPNLTIKSYNPVLKSEIFINKEKLIKEIKNRFSCKNQIRVFFK